MAIVRSPNSFAFLEKEAMEMCSLAEYEGFAVSDIHAATGVFLNEIETILTTNPDDIPALNGAVSSLQGALNPRITECMIGILASCIAHTHEDADTSIVNSHSPALHKESKRIIRNQHIRLYLTQYSLQIPVKQTIQIALQKLDLAVTAVCNFTSEHMPYIRQGDVDSFCYDTYYHNVKCRIISDLCIALQMARHDAVDENDEELKYEVVSDWRGEDPRLAGVLADAAPFINTFFNYMHALSDHPRCSLPLRTVIRTHLIDFANDPMLRGISLDIQRKDLRVQLADIDTANTTSAFYIGEQWKTSQYCHDAEDSRH